MRRLAAALLAAATLLLVGPALTGPAGTTASAHAQLVSSVPGAGQQLDISPAELRLAFTERLDPLGSNLDLLDGEGRAILRSAGSVDAADPRTLVVPLSALDSGLYTVAWRSLSADDGHLSSGFYTFGVGDVVVPGTTDQTGGDIHAGHSLVQSVLETLARLGAQLGALLAVGAALVAAVVVRPLDDGAGRGLGWSATGALLLAGLSAAALLPLNASLAGVGLGDYLVGSDAGRMLAVRAAVGLVGGALVGAIVARGPGWRWVPAMLAGGSIAILLHAASGHATTFSSPAPVLAVAVHMAAAGAWLAGLLTLGWLAFGGAGRRRSLLRAAIPRFSAVALPAVALFGLTGLYLWWLMLRQPLDTSNGYGALLAVKLVGGLAAVAVGGLNYLGWRREGVVGEHRRVAFEAALALGVVAVTALMVSGSPPGLTRPVPIERASTSALSVLDADLALLPARPGPNRVFVTPASPVAAGQRLELVLKRVDASGGTTVELHSATTAAGSAFITDVPLAGDSSWDATVRLLADGVEQARARWTFALDDTRLAAGRAQPLVNPLLLVALALAGLAILALLLVAGGVSPPRTERSVTRGLLLGGGIIGAVLAALMLALPPQV